MRTEGFWVMSVLIIIFMIIPVSAIPNPSAVYCGQLGYEYIIDKTDDGEVGICQFPDGSTARAWDFLRGDVGQEHNYCKEKGYEFRVVVNDSRCPGIYFSQCVLCVSPEGEETEVTELMKEDGKFPDFRKWVNPNCNNNQICEPEKGENHGTCVQDCPSGGKDRYCDGMEDGVCDPDCSLEDDIDCKSDDSRKAGDPEKSYLIYYVLLALLVALLLLFFACRKIQEKKKWEELERKYSP